MKAEDLYHAINDIDDQYIEKAIDHHIKKHNHLRNTIIIIVCCLCIFFMPTFFFMGGSSPGYWYFGTLLPLSISDNDHISSKRHTNIKLSLPIQIKDQYTFTNISPTQQTIQLSYPYMTLLETNDFPTILLNNQEISYQIQIIKRLDNYPTNKEECLQSFNKQEYTLSQIFKNFLSQEVYVYELQNIKYLQEHPDASIEVSMKGECFSYQADYHTHHYDISQRDTKVFHPRFISIEPLSDWHIEDYQDMNVEIKELKMTMKDILDICIQEEYENIKDTYENYMISFTNFQNQIYEYLDMSLQDPSSLELEFNNSISSLISTCIYNIFWSTLELEVTIPADSSINVTFIYEGQFQNYDDNLKYHHIDIIQDHQTFTIEDDEYQCIQSNVNQSTDEDYYINFQ